MNSMKNPSVFLYGPGKAKIEDCPVPQITDPSDTLIRIGFVGVCGSDVHFWNEGGVNGNNVSETKPLVMGHEASGTVEAVGSAVSTSTLVTELQLNHAILVGHMEFAACPPDKNGALTKSFKVSADFCYKLPEHVSLEEGVLAEPLAVAAHAVKMVGIRPGKSVVIFGSGTIGLVCGAVAKYFGAKKVVAVDIADAKLEFARSFNDCTTYKPSIEKTAQENARAIIEENDLDLGADAVIEASGAESSINCAVYVLRPGGQYIQTGLGKPIINFPILTMSEKELHMHGACRYGPDDFQVAMDVLENDTIPVKRLISRIFDFEEAVDAWEATKRGEGIKNMIRGVPQ